MADRIQGNQFSTNLCLTWHYYSKICTEGYHYYLERSSLNRNNRICVFWKNASLVNLITWFDLSVENMEAMELTAKAQLCCCALTFLLGAFSSACSAGTYQWALILYNFPLHLAWAPHLPRRLSHRFSERLREFTRGKIMFLTFKSGNGDRGRDLYLKFAMLTKNGAFIYL